MTSSQYQPQPDRSAGDACELPGPHEAWDPLTACRRMGLLTAGQDATVVPLSGGVSNDVFAVIGETVDVVVKRALPRLRVGEDWFAAPMRSLTEVAALRLAATVRPANVPAIIAVDESAFVMALERAGPDVREWRADLLSGVVDVSVAGRLAEALADWHNATGDSACLEGVVDWSQTFHQLRVEPFYLRVIEKLPGLRRPIQAVLDRMLSTRSCLVHGDYSPKNVLIGSTKLWVIDWEVAHIGDPVFDLAFLVAHLVCKGLHRTQDAASYHEAAQRFVQVYQQRRQIDVDKAYLHHQIACLILARTDGKSRATYLSPEKRALGRLIAQQALIDDAFDWLGFWDQTRYRKTAAPFSG